MRGALKIRIENKRFNAQLAELKRRNGRAGPSMVRFWTRRLVQKAAWLTPIATSGRDSAGRFVRIKNRGRARAGWYPAASMVGLSSVYAGAAPNRKEGRGTDKTGDKARPSMTIENRVPYVTFMRGHGLAWWIRAQAEVRGRMAGELQAKYQPLLKI